MKGKWTICPRLQANTIFQSQNLLHFLCKCQKRERISFPKSEKGKRRLSGWDNIIWKLKKKPNAPLFPPSLPPRLNPEGGKPKFCKGKRDSTILIFLLLFCRGVGLRIFYTRTPLQTGLNPTSGRCWERLPRKFCGGERGGCFLEGEAPQGRWEEERKAATEARSKSPF